MNDQTKITVSGGELEFSRPVNVDKIKSLGLREKIHASQLEREKLIIRLGLNGLDDLTFECELMPWKKGGARLKGTVTATIQEICVVSLEPFKTEVKESVERVFTHPTSSRSSEVVLDMEDLDDEYPDSITENSIDIGEVAVETLALTLSLHPRKPGAIFSDHIESDPAQERQSAKKNPFEVLKSLK